jgi:hypothetical protein
MSFDPISAALDIGGKIIDRLWPDPAQAQAAKLQLLQMQQSGQLAELTADTDIAKAQIAVDQAEAASTSLFVAGWRPAIGWTCAAGFAYAYVAEPAAEFTARVVGYAGPFPSVDIASMMPILLGLLGLGAMRTIEKVKGVGAGTDVPAPAGLKK